MTSCKRKRARFEKPRRTNDESNSARHQANSACEEQPQDCEKRLDCIDSERKDALEDGEDRIEQAAQGLPNRVVEVPY